MIIKKTSLLTILFYMFIFFPYLKITPFNTDTQPGALILSVLIIFTSLTVGRKKIPKSTLPFFFISIVSVLILLMSGITFNGIRSILGYISLPIVTYGSFLILRKDNELNTNIIKIFIWIWLIVGAIQLIYNPTFLSGIVSDMRTSGMRGVTSLAAEPTYFGQMLYFLLFIVYIFFQNNADRIKYSLLCVLGIFFLARSSMIVLILAINLLIFILNSLIKRWSTKTIKYIVFSGFILFIGIIVLNLLPETSRLVTTMNNIIQNGIFDFFRSDASSNHRLSSIYISFKGAIENYLIPNGFNKWITYEAIQKSQSNFFWYGSTVRIMSMYGALLFEIGFFGLIIIYLINKWMILFLKKYNFEYNLIPILAYINLIFITAVPLSTPFIGFLLGVLIYYTKYRTTNNKLYKKMEDYNEKIKSNDCSRYTS